LDISTKLDICSLDQCSLEGEWFEEQRVPRCAVSDKPAGFVRYLRPGSEGDLAMHERYRKDRRIQKTMNLLHEALGSLIREKPYDEIVVQDILDRANVGRSTFYMHFRDKDELLASGIHDMLGSVHTTVQAQSSGEPYRRIVRFGLPVFEHIHQHRQTGTAMMGTRGRAIAHEHLQKVVAEPDRGGRKETFSGTPKGCEPDSARSPRPVRGVDLHSGAELVG
jgi:hypothetical protein